MNQYIIPLPHNDPRLLSHVSHAFSLVDLGKRLLDAAKNGDVEEVRNLMSNGAPFTTDWLGISPLHFAAMNGHLTSCEALLRAGICRDARTKVDRTPLHLAAQEGHADIVELLLISGADLEAKDMLRMTALHWAAERGHAPVIQMLMRFGASAHVLNKFEMSPLDIALNKGHTDARDAMLSIQHDLASSTGHMTVMNGELPAASAYILTDEKTLVPAAPPAGEVIVTATTVEEDEEHRQELEAATAAALVEEQTRAANHAFGNGVTDLDLAVRNIGDRPDSMASEPYHNGIDLLGNQSFQSLESRETKDDEERDVMLVETPEGDMLCVRQQISCSSFTTAGDNPLGLAIYTSSGERIDDPPLLAQVVEVISKGMPSQQHNCFDGASPDGVASAGGTNLTIGMLANGCPNGSSCVNSPVPEFSPSLTASTEIGLQSPPTIATGFRIDPNLSWKTNGQRYRSYRTKELHTSSAEVVVNGAVKTRISPGDPSLLAQLAAFTNEMGDWKQDSVCVEGVGAEASSEDVYIWCMYHGLYPRGYTSDPDFVVEFVLDDDTYTLLAFYDAETGTITFHRAVDCPTKQM